jgi:hypothetical protein
MNTDSLLTAGVVLSTLAMIFVTEFLTRKSKGN